MTKRLFGALLIAVALAGAARQMAVVGGSPMCASLSPEEDPWLWWFFDCKDSGAGGGGSGAK